MVEFKADPETEYYEDIFDLETEYVCYCVVGLRSAFVTDRLDGMGYDIANLEGGIEAWKEVGGEVVPDEDYNSGRTFCHHFAVRARSDEPSDSLRSSETPRYEGNMVENSDDRQYTDRNPVRTHIRKGMNEHIPHRWHVSK